MTNDIASRVENLSKLYHIGRARQRHDTLRDALVDTFQRWNVHTLLGMKRAEIDRKLDEIAKELSGETS